MLKAKTSKMQGEGEWKAILRERLENDFHGFQHAVKTAHDLMNDGFLPAVKNLLIDFDRARIVPLEIRNLLMNLLAASSFALPSFHLRRHAEPGIPRCV